MWRFHLPGALTGAEFPWCNCNSCRGDLRDRHGDGRAMLSSSCRISSCMIIHSDVEPAFRTKQFVAGLATYKSPHIGMGIVDSQSGPASPPAPVAGVRGADDVSVSGFHV